MAQSFDQLSKSLGINTRGAAGANVAFERSPQAAKPKPSGLDFAKNVAASVVRVPVQAAQAVGASVAKGITDTAKGISQAITQPRQQQANENYRQAIESASKRYQQLYASGKMSKTQYTKLSQDLIKQSQSLSDQIRGEVADMVTPKDFAMGLTGTAAIPLSAGRLAAQAGAGVAAKTATALGATSKGQSAVAALAKAPLKYPLITAPVAQAPVQIADDLKKGKVGSAAVNTALLASPVAIAGGAKLGKKLAPIVKDAVLGKSAVLTDAFGRGKVEAYLKSNPQKAPILKMMEQFTLTQPAVGGNAAKGGEFLAGHLKSIGVDAKAADMDNIVKQFVAYAKNVQKLELAKRPVSAPIPAKSIAQDKVMADWFKAKHTPDEYNAKVGFTTDKGLTFEGLGSRGTPLWKDKDGKSWEGNFGDTDAQLFKDAKSPAELAAAKSGMPIKLERQAIPANAVVSADFRDVIPAVVKKLQAVEGANAVTRVKVANEALDELGIKNQTIRDQIGAAILQGADAKELKPIVQKLIIPGVKLEKGFIATIGPENRAVLPTLREAKEMGAPDLGRKALPVIGAISKAADKAGVGIRDYNPAQIGMARDNFIKGVEGKLKEIDGKSVYDELSALADEKRITDIRQLRVAEIAQRLDVSMSDAKQVLNSAKSMYDGVPLSVRGAAGKLQDANLKFNPLAPGYARIQSALRYGYNPFFRAQQRIEAASIGQVVSGGFKPVGDVSKTVKLMRENGMIPGQNKGFAGEALDDVAGQTKITQALTPSEENSLARVLQATAQKNGTKVEDELANEETRQLLRAIVQNPKQGILSSNFAKATNMLFFPATYNAKVTSLALKALVEAPPATQFAVIKGVNDFHNWTQTDAGIKWKSDNSEVLGLLGYFTPVNSIQQTMKFLGTGNVRELGLIGGLPFGVITRVLEGQGITPKSQPPYVNPKTGEVVPDRIPETEKARLQQAVGDILDTMFTFPGRTAGLGSKTDLRDTLTGGVLKPAPNEVRSVDRSEQLKPADKNKARVLQSLAKPPAAPLKKASSTLPATTRPTVTRPTIVPIKRTESSSGRRRTKTLAKRPGQI